GTTFTITVPVTVSTVRILTVATGGQYYGILTTPIRRTGRARPEDLRELQGSLVLPINGQPISWVHLAELLGGQPAKPLRKGTVAAGNTSGQVWSYLVLAHQGGQLAVAVDDLEDEAEVLLKPLGFPLSGFPGVVGATIRPDGSVQLV